MSESEVTKLLEINKCDQCLNISRFMGTMGVYDYFQCGITGQKIKDVADINEFCRLPEPQLPASPTDNPCDSCETWDLPEACHYCMRRIK